MRPTRHPIGLVAAVLLLAATVLAAPATASAQNRQTAQEEYPGTFLQVAALACPPGYAGDAYAADCAEPLPGLTFGLDDDATDGPSDIADNRTTDADGVALWEDLSPGGYALVDGPSGATVVDRLAVACVVEADPARPLPVEDLGNGVVRFEVAEAIVAADEDIFCSWYGAPAGGSAGAPAPPARQSVPIYALICESDPGTVGTVRAPFPPAGCVGAAGVAVTVEAAEDGADIGRCTTDEEGRCAVDAPSGAEVVVSEDPTTIPAGYEPRENPIELQVYTEFAEAVFVNLPATATGPGDGDDGDTGIALELRVMACPTGFASADRRLTDADLVAYAETCGDAPLADVDIALTGARASGSPPHREATTGEDGTVRFEGILAGEVTLTEGASRTGRSLVDYTVPCTVGGEPTASLDVQYDGAAGVRVGVPIDAVETGQDIFCDWYNVPIAENDASGGSVGIQALDCPEGYASDDFADYAANCVDPVPNVAYEVTFGPTGGGVSLSTDADGVAAFVTPAPRTRLTVVESDAPAGGSPGQVLCGAPGEDPLPVEQLDDGGIALNVAAGEELACAWYRVAGGDPGATPPGDGGTFTVEARLCPPGYRTDDFTTHVDICAEPATGIDFYATFGENAASDEPAATTDAVGVAVIEAPAEDSSLLLVEGPAGSLDPSGNELGLVYCRIGEREEVPFDDVQGDGISLELPGGEDVTCTWYVVPPSTAAFGPAPSTDATTGVVSRPGSPDLPGTTGREDETHARLVLTEADDAT